MIQTIAAYEQLVESCLFQFTIQNSLRLQVVHSGINRLWPQEENNKPQEQEKARDA